MSLLDRSHYVLIARREPVKAIYAWVKSTIYHLPIELFEQQAHFILERHMQAHHKVAHHLFDTITITSSYCFSGNTSHCHVKATNNMRVGLVNSIQAQQVTTTEQYRRQGARLPDLQLHLSPTKSSRLRFVKEARIALKQTLLLCCSRKD